MPAPLPIGGLTIASIGLTAVVVGNAYYQKQQFYPSVVYITKSNPSMAAIYLLAFTLVILLGKLLKKVFFGQLRTAEFEQLIERSFYAVTETCLAFTVFRDDFSPKFVALFTVLLFLKAFHYLTDSRVDFMERSPVITVIFHIRVASLLGLLMLLDLLLLNHSYLSTITHGASVQLVFGFEYAILLTVGLNITIKYLCHTIDLRSENPWENKAVYLLYTELLVGFVKVILYVVFLFIMIRIHTFPLFIIRPMYLTIRSFKNALNDVIQSRRAIHNMNTLYPDASAEELALVDNVCIICREEMVTGAKKLPCGHIFHSSCLRSWFQRQQTCPTCRMDILQQPAVNQGNQNAAPVAPNAAAGAAAARPQATPPLPPQPANHNVFGNFNAAMNFGAGLRPPFPFAPFPFNNNMQQNMGGQVPLTPNVGGASSGGPLPTAASGQQPPAGMPFAGMPPFLPFMGFNIPPPAPPLNFEGLTLEELKQMEGNERKHVEARIKTLKNIQTLLDAAVVQLSQYSHVVNSLPTEATTETKNTDSSNTEEEKSSASAEAPVVESLSSSSTSPANKGAVGGARPKTTSPSAEPSTKPSSPSTNDSSFDSQETDDAREIRLRRLERFSGSSAS